MTTFALPDLGEGLIEAEIVSWHVGEGDHVVADQPLVSVETEKAVVEIPSPRAGRIARLFGKPGERIRVGAPLVAFETGPAADAGAVVGDLPAAGKAAPKPLPAAPHPAGAARAMPAVRALAQRLGVDLATVSGTGPGGAVTTGDVEQAAAGTAKAAGFEPLRGARRAMAQSMARAQAEVPLATIMDEADIDVWPGDADVTVRLVRAIVAAAQAEPALNAWYDGRTMSRHLHARLDLAVAMDTKDGLFAPVLRGVGDRSPAEIRRGLDELKAAVASRSAALADLRGATFTLSNFGTLGGRYAALVVVPPQVAILGAGRAGRSPMVVDGAIGMRRMLPLSLSFDHRAVTGGEAARFLAAAVADLAKPD